MTKLTNPTDLWHNETKADSYISQNCTTPHNWSFCFFILFFNFQFFLKIIHYIFFFIALSVMRTILFFFGRIFVCWSFKLFCTHAYALELDSLSNNTLPLGNEHTLETIFFLALSQNNSSRLFIFRDIYFFLSKFLRIGPVGVNKSVFCVCVCFFFG